MSGIILEASGLRKFYGDRKLLDIEKLEISDGDRIGLIGENGAGKSTLIGILSGLGTADEGNVRLYGSTAVIRQMGLEDGEISDRARSEFRVPGNSDGLSGGEKTRRRMAAAFSADTNLLIADEPTTDLDAQGIEQLKKRLQGFRGAVLLVSHDRDLLNLICTRIWHLEDGKISDFPGSYAAYQKELANRREHQQFEYDQYRAEQARLKASAQKMLEKTQQVKKAPSRMGNSEARLHRREASDAVLGLSHRKNLLTGRMERLEKKERPRDLPDIRMDMGTESPIEARFAVTAKGISLKAGSKQLLKNASFDLSTGSRTALIGANGCGKTTLLKAICGGEAPGITLSGKLRIHNQARIGWFDQDHTSTLDMEKTALENVMRSAVCDESTARTVMARLNIRGDDVFKPVHLLSGGERAKIALAKLLISDCNVLVLDEPTNHLDIFTLEELEKMLCAYRGTLLMVSHDREFIYNVADCILAIDSLAVNTFEGTLDRMEAEKNRDRDREKLQLEITTLQMRQAMLASRMAAPGKGDSPEKLSSEYEELIAQIREKKRLLESR